MSVVRGWLRGLHWYLREVTGEADYDHYLARHAQLHLDPTGCPRLLTRREFELRRWQDRSQRPGTRCC